MTKQVHGDISQRLGVLLGVALWLVGLVSGLSQDVQTRQITLDECIRLALLQNRTLQIERLNPAITESTLSGSYGYYDPILTLEARKEQSTDPGGFDPTDFNRDTIYSADSELVRGGLGGFLPGGFNYALAGGYAHSDGERNGLNFDAYSLLTGVAVRQPLLRNFWIDQGRMTIQINKKNLTISELGVRYVTMDTINRVQHAYYELTFTTGQVRVQQELLETRKNLLASVRRKIELGTLTVLDERLADAEVADVETTLNVADNAKRLAENELRLQVGDSWTNSVTTRLDPSDPLFTLSEQLDLKSCWQRGLSGRPDLVQLRQDVEKAKINTRYRRNQLFPSLDVVASHNRKGASTEQLFPPGVPEASFSAARDQITDNDAPSDMLGVVFSVPLDRTAERANFRASKQLGQQAELRVKQLEEQVMREISDAVHTARSCYERVGLTRRARELSESALAAEEQKLAGGKSTLFVVLQLQGELASSRSAELRAKADYNRALSQLHFADATLLEREYIFLEIK